MVLESVITCPHCAATKAEQMPTDACQFFYVCTGCGATLRPKHGDCRVFCSYGSVPCPPIQAGRSGQGTAASCCAKQSITRNAHPYLSGLFDQPGG
jgi:hypothetical protein